MPDSATTRDRVSASRSRNGWDIVDDPALALETLSRAAILTATGNCEPPQYSQGFFRLIPRHHGQAPDRPTLQSRLTHSPSPRQGSETFG
jgi:hypothetical protein